MVLMLLLDASGTSRSLSPPPPARNRRVARRCRDFCTPSRTGSGCLDVREDRIEAPLHVVRQLEGARLGAKLRRVVLFGSAARGDMWRAMPIRSDIDLLVLTEGDVDEADQDFRASVEVPLDVEGAKKMFKLIDALEDSDDVQDVYTNMDLSDEVLAALDD